MIKNITEIDYNDNQLIVLEFDDNKSLTLKVEGLDTDLIKIEFYSDKKLKTQLDGEFQFLDENFNEEYSTNKLKLVYFFSPKDYVRRGVGEFIVKWVREVTDSKSIYTSDPFDATIKDSSQVTGTGVNFVIKMRRLGLIEDPDEIDENHSNY